MPEYLVRYEMKYLGEDLRLKKEKGLPKSTRVVSRARDEDAVGWARENYQKSWFNGRNGEYCIEIWVEDASDIGGDEA